MSDLLAEITRIKRALRTAEYKAKKAAMLRTSVWVSPHWPISDSHVMYLYDAPERYEEGFNFVKVQT